MSGWDLRDFKLLNLGECMVKGWDMTSDNSGRGAGQAGGLLVDHHLLKSKASFSLVPTFCNKFIYKFLVTVLSRTVHRCSETLAGNGGHRGGCWGGDFWRTPPCRSWTQNHIILS